MHILHVEDNPVFQAFIKEEVEKLGGKYTSVDTKEQALNVTNQVKVDLVICDFNLGEGKEALGLEIARELKEKGHLVLFVTNNHSAYARRNFPFIYKTEIRKIKDWIREFFENEKK